MYKIEKRHVFFLFRTDSLATNPFIIINIAFLYDTRNVKNCDKIEARIAHCKVNKWENE